MSEYKPQYPEHEKLSTVQLKSQAAGEFVDWLSERGIMLCERQIVTYPAQTFEDGTTFKEYTREMILPTPHRLIDLLAVFFEIDQHAIEAEKKAMLAICREKGDQNGS